MTAAMWRMWAGLDDGLWWHPGEEWYVREYGHEPRQVTVTEDPDGQYWGWLDAADDAPSMIWPKKVLFDCCFPYGPDAEQERGRGRIVRLTIEPAKET